MGEDNGTKRVALDVVPMVDCDSSLLNSTLSGPTPLPPEIFHPRLVAHLSGVLSPARLDLRRVARDVLQVQFCPLLWSTCYGKHVEYNNSLPLFSTI